MKDNRSSCSLRVRYKPSKPNILNDNTDNLRGNQLPAALKESHVSVNKYINPIFYNDNTDNYAPVTK